MLKVNSGEKPERRRSVVSFAEETTIIGTSDGSDEAREEPEKREGNKTGKFVLPSLNCKFQANNLQMCNWAKNGQIV